MKTATLHSGRPGRRVEYGYALAVRLREAGQTAEARMYAAQCLRLAEALPSKSLHAVTSDRAEVGGVPLPERFRDGVVRAPRLADLLDG